MERNQPSTVEGRDASPSTAAIDAWIALTCHRSSDDWLLNLPVIKSQDGRWSSHSAP